VAGSKELFLKLKKAKIFFEIDDIES